MSKYGIYCIKKFECPNVFILENSYSSTIVAHKLSVTLNDNPSSNTQVKDIKDLCSVFPVLQLNVSIRLKYSNLL